MCGINRAIGKVETVVRVRGADTGGAYAVVEQWHPVNRGAPLHFHRFEAETLLVVKGSYVVQLDGESQRLGPGQSVTVQPGAAHAFANKGDGAGCLLILAVPAGIEDYFDAMSELDWSVPDARDKLNAIEARFGIVGVQADG